MPVHELIKKAAELIKKYEKVSLEDLDDLSVDEQMNLELAHQIVMKWAVQELLKSE